MIVVDSFLQVPLDGADKYLVTSSIARAPNRSRRYPRNIPGVARGNAKFCSGGARSIPGPAGRGLNLYLNILKRRNPSTLEVMKCAWGDETCGDPTCSDFLQRLKPAASKIFC